jgi:hypothetical protein
MLCPHGPDFFVRRELATLGFGQRGVQVSFFFGRELIRRLLDARELQEYPREFVLRVVRQSGHGLNGLFKQTGHAGNIVVSALLRKPGQEVLQANFRPHGFPIAIAIAAARNGNGTDTAARNQTKRAGMKGISHRIRR